MKKLFVPSLSEEQILELVIIRLDNKEVKTVSLKTYREWARPACLYCLDYGGENADIGAGGIGLELNGAITTLAWTQVSLILLVIIGTVVLSEWVSAKVRHAII